MPTPDMATVLVVGAMAGLLFFALGYAQLVWFTRHQKMAEAARETRATRLRRWALRALLPLTAICFLRAVTATSLTERSAILQGEELASVRPRPGLAAHFEASGVDVRRDEVLVRFMGQDGEDPQRSLQNQLELLEAQLELARGQPLEFDPELVRRAAEARREAEKAEFRMQQLASERDLLVRERTQQRLELTQRQFRIEQGLRAADHELAPLKARLETERQAEASDETLASRGFVSPMEAARARDTVAALESNIGQLEDQRRLLSRELQEMSVLRTHSEDTLVNQLESRSAELAAQSALAEAARHTLALAESALEKDRPRAEAQREKRLRLVQLQLDECRALLGDKDRQLVYRAPWDGRIGFREPSPASSPADTGPLLILYRPDAIAAQVRLEPGEADAISAELIATMEFSESLPQDGAVSRKPLPGRVVKRTQLSDGSGELQIACDPPDRIVRQLAMGGVVPVQIQLRRPLAGMWSFRFGLLCGGLALALALLGALGSGTSGAQAAEGTALQDASGLGHRAYTRESPPPGRETPYIVHLGRLTGGFAELQPTTMPFRPEQLGPRELADPASATQRLAAALSSGAFVEASLQVQSAVDPRELGARLRAEIEEGVVTPHSVRQAAAILARGGYEAAFLASGYGRLDDPKPIERAAFGLLAAPRAGAVDPLGEATRDCAQFLRVVRALSTMPMGQSLDLLRLSLISATLQLARQAGTPQAVAGEAIAALV